MQTVPTPPPDPAPPSRSAHDDLPRTFGRYTLFELIGKGGMAQIYLAREETELGATRLAVVKEILPTFADDPRFAEMLTYEAKLAARLSHRHLVQVFDLGREDSHLFIAMEYVEGFDLNALLRQCTEKKVGLPAPHALGIVADVLEGLDYAHRREDEFGVPLGLVHRDVSPSNVLISYEGEVKLCDFGIAHANELVKGPNEALKGKAGYMSPEHALGEAIDARADVFAAGIILWELLAGRRLYGPRSETPLLEQARTAAIPLLPDKGLPNHARLEGIVQKALARNPDDRYSSAGALLRDLEEYLAAEGLMASRLKLGEWMSSTLGTGILDQRRASERKLPKSSHPPPRSSERLMAAAPSVTADRENERVQAVVAPRLPTSEGAILAFKRELKKPRASLAHPAPEALHDRATREPESLAAVDLSPPSSFLDAPRGASVAKTARASWLLLAGVVLAILLVAALALAFR